MGGLVPAYPRIRLLSPTHRRIAYVHPGSPTHDQLHTLGWNRYDGPATVVSHHAGPGRLDAAMRPDADPRNGFIVPGSDPDLIPSERPAGTVDFDPHVGEIV